MSFIVCCCGLMCVNMEVGKASVLWCGEGSGHGPHRAKLTPSWASQGALPFPPTSHWRSL